MRIGFCLMALGVGLLLRCAVMSWHDTPRGDVLLDVSVARSVAAGEGYASGFHRGMAFVFGDGPVPPQDRADQHGPLWPTMGVALSVLTGSSFSGLKLGSLLCGFLCLLLVWRMADRLTEGISGCPDGIPALATSLVALSFPLVEFSGNGSLYMAQTVLVLLLVECLCRPGYGTIGAGVVLGLAWLLNYQSMALLPVPLVVLMLTASSGDRGKALRAGTTAIAVAVAMQIPWWWRNGEVFGALLYSVNPGHYLVHAGLGPSLGMEDGLPVARFIHSITPQLLVTAPSAWLLPQVLYVFTTGLILLPGSLALVGAGGLSLASLGIARKERRPVACIVVLLVLLLAALAWPGIKLRYLVPLLPLIVLVAVRVAVSRPLPGEKWGLLAVGGLWLTTLFLTRDDLFGTADVPRPERWWITALGGLGSLGLPILLRWRNLSRQGVGLVLASGLLFVPTVTVLIYGTSPSSHPLTSYHSSWLTPDFYGKHKEIDEAAEMEALFSVAKVLHEEGAKTVAAPFGLIFEKDFFVVTLPLGAGSFQEEALVSLVDRFDVDHVVTPESGDWPTGLRPGVEWLSGRLEVVRTVDSASESRGFLVSRVHP